MVTKHLFRRFSFLANPARHNCSVRTISAYKDNISSLERPLSFIIKKSGLTLTVENEIKILPIGLLSTFYELSHLETSIWSSLTFRRVKVSY